MTWAARWKALAKRYRAGDREHLDWIGTMVHRDLDRAGVPSSTFYPGGRIYDGCVARVSSLVDRYLAQGDARAVPKRDFDIAIQLRDMANRDAKDAYERGAAVAFGLMGMAFAIDEGFAWCKECQSWKLDCVCPYRPPVEHTRSDPR